MSFKDVYLLCLTHPFSYLHNFPLSSQESNDNYAKGKCEATDPLYDLVTNSKVSLVHRAIEWNAVKTDYIIWLDGGYGHGDRSIYPSDHIWHPKHLLSHPGTLNIVLEMLKLDFNRLQMFRLSGFSSSVISNYPSFTVCTASLNLLFLVNIYSQNLIIPR